MFALARATFPSLHLCCDGPFFGVNLVLTYFFVAGQTSNTVTYISALLGVCTHHKNLFKMLLWKDEWQCYAITSTRTCLFTFKRGVLCTHYVPFKGSARPSRLHDRVLLIYMNTVMYIHKSGFIRNI